MHGIGIEEAADSLQDLPIAQLAIRRNLVQGSESLTALLRLKRRERSTTLGLLRPASLAKVVIKKASSPDWSADEVAKLMQAQRQGSLFDEDAEQRSLKLLRKIPFDFHYQYRCDGDGAVVVHKHKIVDWEAGALYWNIHRRPDWQAAFRQKFLNEFSQRDLLFLMGTIHRFPDQWLIVSVLYFPK